MTEQRNRGSVGARPALVIDGEAVVVARHPRAKPMGEAWTDAGPAMAEPAYPRAGFGRARPQPVRRRKPPAPDLVFQTAPKQRFAVPMETRASVLPRAAWIAGLIALAVLTPLAALSVSGRLQGDGPATAVAAVAAVAPAAEKPVRILYGIPLTPPTQMASAGETRPAPLPGVLAGVYPVTAGSHPAGVARLVSVGNVRDMKAAGRRTPIE